MGEFRILLSCLDKRRPRISQEVLDYESYIRETVLRPKGIILKSKISVDLVFVLIWKQKESNKVWLYPPTYTKEDNSKFYPVEISLEAIVGSKDPFSSFLDYLNRGISIFFIENYKSIDKEFMSDVMKNIDNEYLVSLKYHHKIKSVKYVGGDLGW